MISPYIRPFPEMLLDDWNRQHEGDQDCSEVSHAPRSGGVIEACAGSRVSQEFYGRFSGAAGEMSISSLSPTFNSAPESKLNSPFSILKPFSR
jgi:hypothetical protein